VNISRPRKVFVNLPVSDLERAKTFFSVLGFQFNPQFTDDKAACMILSEEGYVMLLRREFFATFTQRPVADERAPTEVLVALSCESREEVSALTKLAIESGGRAAMPPQDHGFMVASSFYDPDGHHWEVIWMDPAHVQPTT
jgi:predicted lactoylglutathione lyase